MFKAVHSFIHSGHFYSAPSSPLLLRGAPDYSTDTVSNDNQMGRVWCTGRVDAFPLKGHGFDSRSSCQVGTLGKSFTRSCLWCFRVKLRHSIRAVSGEPRSSSGLEETL